MDSLCPSGLHTSLRNPKECKATPGPLDERVGRSLGALARERRRGYVGIDDTRPVATQGSSGSSRDIDRSQPVVSFTTPCRPSEPSSLRASALMPPIVAHHLPPGSVLRLVPPDRFGFPSPPLGVRANRVPSSAFRSLADLPGSGCESTASPDSKPGQQARTASPDSKPAPVLGFGSWQFRRRAVQTANPANLGLHPDGGEAPRSCPRMGTSPGRTPFASGEAQMCSRSCIHAGMSRWPCSTRQTSTWSERST